MLKFFRKIRQSLLTENKFSKYLLYAIGEILLVVIGILIALQINNWNNDQKERDLEKQYISGLINDLRLDSVAIAELKVVSDEQVRRKEELSKYLEGHPYPGDSVAHYFALQWGMSVDFTPVTTTFDEMKSVGRIRVIRNTDMRKRIIKTYNDYQAFTNQTLSYYERHRTDLRKEIFKIPYVFDKSVLDIAEKPDIVKALQKHEVRNGVLANYAISVNRDLKTLQEENKALLQQLFLYEEALV